MSRTSRLSVIGIGFIAIAICGAVAAYVNWPKAETPAGDARAIREPEPRNIEFGDHLTLWWERIPDKVKDKSFQTGSKSNIHPRDYAGPEACRKCHSQNYQNWSRHPHKKMNALAIKENVLGDFSGNAKINYLGGTGTFTRKGGRYFMNLERGDVRLEYAVTQTIGSRFYQYYVGKLLRAAGVEPFNIYYATDHLLPFGYWLDRREWVPVVHVLNEVPDGERIDPYDLTGIPVDGENYVGYHFGCNYCHTTFPLGDMLIRNPALIGRHAPVGLHWGISDYLSEAHPDLWESDRDPSALPQQEMLDLMSSIVLFEAPEHAVTLGVSCEACHLGARARQESENPAEVFSAKPPSLCGSEAGGLRFFKEPPERQLGVRPLPLGKPPAIRGGHGHLELHGIHRRDAGVLLHETGLHQVPQSARRDWKEMDEVAG